MYGIFFHCDEWKFPHDLCHAVQEIKDTLSPWLLLVPFYPAIANSVKSFFGEKAAAEGAAEGGGKAAAEGAAEGGGKAAAEAAAAARKAAAEAAARKAEEEALEQAAEVI